VSGRGAAESDEDPVGEYETRSAAETEALGSMIASGLVAGDVVVIGGEIGAGKTTLIRGACRRLGVTEAITSPTFTIGHTYAGRVPVSHLDLYRLEALESEDPALLEDYLTPDSIAFIEWPGLAEPHLSAGSLRVELDHAGADRRSVRVSRLGT